MPGAVLGICHKSYVTTHISSHQMRVPGWSRDKHPGSQAACFLNVAPGLISECSFITAPSQINSDLFIYLEQKGSVTFFIDMFLVSKAGNLSCKNIHFPPLPSTMALNEAIFILKVLVFSCVRLFVTPWTVAHQVSLSVEFSRQEYWSELPFPSSGESSPPRDHTWVSCIAGRLFTN